MYPTYPNSSAAVGYNDNPQQAEANVQYVFQNINQTLTQLSSRYSSQIINTVVNYLQNPAAQNAIRNDVIQIFGGLAISPQELINYVTRKCNDLCLQAQQNLINAQYDYRGYYGVQQTPPIGGFGQGAAAAAPQQYIYPTQSYTPSYMNHGYQSSAGDDIGSIYGNQSKQQRAEMTSPYAPQVQPSQAKFVDNNAQVQQTRVGTGKAYDVSLKEDDDIIFQRPEWKEETVDKATPLIDPNVMTLGKLWAIEAKNKQIKAAAVRIKEPVDNTESAMLDLIYNAKPLFAFEKYAHIVEFDEIRVCHADFESSKRFFDECMHILEKDKANSISSVVNVLSALQSQGEFGKFMGNVLLEKFNRAASVNFLQRRKEDGVAKIYKLSSIKSIADLSRLLTDSNDKDFEPWKAQDEDFRAALGLTLKASFNKIFKKGNFLNPNKPEDRLAILGSHSTGLRFGPNKKTGIQILADVSSEKDIEKINADVDTTLNSVFCLKVENKVLIHNLDMPKVEANNFSAVQLTGTTEAVVLAEFLNKFGNIELLDTKDPTQSTHPLELGMDYLSRLLVRRMY